MTNFLKWFIQYLYYVAIIYIVLFLSDMLGELI